MNGKVTYRQQFTRCGKERCRKCREGAGHGPYWYAYWSKNGRTVSKYIGTHLPKEIADMKILSPDTPAEEALPTPPSDAPSPAHTPLLRIYVLGQFRIERKQNNEWSAIDSRTWHRRRARALLGCLISSPGRRQGREQIIEQLWPELDIDVAINRLHGAVHELRQILEPGITRPATSRLLRLDHDVLELADSSHIWVDADAFEALLKEAHSASTSEQKERLLEEAAQLYQGSYLLEELYSEWAAPRRDILQRAWTGLLINLAHLRAEQGSLVSAIETLDRLRTADPANETALQRLMILLTHLDRRGEALHLYRQHLSLLERDYGGEPLPETTRLFEALRRGHVPELYAPKTPPGTTTQTKNATLIEARSTNQSISFHRPLFQVGRHRQSPLIGRERELTLMQQTLQTVEQQTNPVHKTAETSETMDATLQSGITHKHPHFLLLMGEPGIGKTRLAEEVSLEAHNRGWAIAWSRSYEQERTIPYRPWTELLRTFLKHTSIERILQQADIHNTEERPSLLHFKLERLSTLLPELAVYFPSSTKKFVSTLPHEQERLHLWEAVLGLLDLLSTIHPLLLVFDDLHWTDDSSIELLTYLTHHLQEQRIMFIATCRDAELDPLHKLHTLIADLRREKTIVPIPIKPLSQSQIGSLLAHLPGSVVKSIQHQAAGNPFFAEELARFVNTTPEELTATLTDMTTHQGSSTSTSSTDTTQQQVLPEAISAVLERRLGKLSPACQNLLGRAAILGGSFELRQLLPMATEHNEDAVVDLLEEALYAGLLTEQGTGAHITFHFWHPLIISHLYERLSAARRAQLHRKAAEAIKATCPPSQQDKMASLIVHHLSRGGGDPTQVASYAELAGNQAYSLAGFFEARRYYLQALQALIHNDLHTPENSEVATCIRSIDAPTITNQTLPTLLQICRLLERTAECCVVLGDFEGARHLYQSIVTIRTGERFQQQSGAAHVPAQRQQEAQIQALLWREIGTTWAATGDYRRAYDCYGRGKEVMQQAGVTTGPAWACLHLQFGNMSRLEGNYEEARRYLQEALTILEQVIQPAPATGEQLETHVTPLDLQPASSRDLPTRIERALSGDPLELAYAHERLGIVAASVVNFNDAFKHMHIALRIYEQSELITEMARICGNLGAVCTCKGDYEVAQTYMHRSLELAERAGDIPNMTFIMGNIADVAHRLGHLQESKRWYHRSLALAEQINDRERISWFQVELAAVQQDLGYFAEARVTLLRALSTARELKSSRCIRYGLVQLGNLRITEALTLHASPEDMLLSHPGLNARRQQLLRRAKATLQRALSSNAGLETESILHGKYLLAITCLWLNEYTMAQQLAQETLQEAQNNELPRNTGHAYWLQAHIQAHQHHYEQACANFEQAIQIFRERQLRLELARTLFEYGTTILGWDTLSTKEAALPLLDIRTAYTGRNIEPGRSYLYQAQTLFTTCQAAGDLSRIRQFFSFLGIPETASAPSSVTSHI